MKIAVEYERGLHNADFTIANIAQKFLTHSYNINRDGQPVFHKEGTLHQNEFNSRPYDNIHDLVNELLLSEEVNSELCQQLGVYNIPISETGAGEGVINPNVKHRTEGYRVIFGQDALDDLLKISGIHIHVDQSQPRIVDQFNALTALRPAIALMSTSSISHQRRNGVNCHRYKLISDPEVGVFARIPENNKYIKSIEELKQRDEQRYNDWFTDFSKNCHKFGLTSKYFLENFSVANTGYPDIRSRPDIAKTSTTSKPTFELRPNDTNTYQNVIAKVALVLGYCRNMIENKIPVRHTNIDRKYEFGSRRILLPNEDSLQHYTALGGQHGLLKDDNNTYLQQIVAFAEIGLPQDQRPYLDPFKQMLNSGINVASEILFHIGHGGPYTEEESASANKFMYDKQQQDIYFLEANNV
jgi:hypothetical protein